MLIVGVSVLTVVGILALPARAKDQSGVWKASELLKMKVQGTDGKSLGSIRDLVIDPAEGDIEYAVLDFGGFAGIGDKYFAVPWDALQLDQSKKKLVLDVSKKDLKQAPGFDKKNWPNLSEQRVIIYEFYGVPLSDDQKSKDDSKPSK
ncbi:MAG: PRC-barrel domain-containing protein [Nitrospirae bacterium]|nr:PRC-barrel domain-containing protein [Nitrospirota bacterium]MDE3221127.1 PRC-barrel domain-containing protein [Nitrospirota bacterium]